MGKPHKHSELIKLWADGAEIQYRPVPNHGEWQDEPRHLIWEEFAEYRIKPEPKPDWICNFQASPLGAIQVKPYNANLKLTFDGETGELKSAEVLK